MATLTSSLIVSLIDRVTAPARAAANAIRGITQAAAAANRGGIAGMVERNNAALGQMHGRLLGAVAASYSLYKGISMPLKAAIDFETAMSNVRKVVDFPNVEAFKKMGDDIRALSKQMPMTAGQIADIVQAAGQGGVASKDLLTFAEGVVKVSTAWDTAAGMTGEALAQMMTAMGLSVPEVMKLADVMNYLSNETAASAPKILDFMQRVGPSGKSAGFAAAEVAAYGTAMISAGHDADVAATTFRRMAGALTLGSSATKRQKAAFNALGTDSVTVSKMMQKNAAGTTEAILDRIAAMPKDKQRAFIHDIFGEEARAIDVLITQRELSKAALALARSQKAVGSAQREYDIRLETTKNKLTLFRNEVDDLSRSIGFALMPAFNASLEILKPYIVRLNAWVKANPELVATIAKVTTGLVGFRVAALAGGYAFRFLAKGALLSVLTPLAALTRGFGGLVTGGLLAVLQPMRLVTGALGVLRGALLLSGIGALLVAIGVAGKFVADNWDGLSKFIEQFAASFRKGLGADASKLDAFLKTIEKIGAWMSGDSMKLDDSTWKTWGENAGATAAKVALKIIDAMESIIAAIGKIPEAWRSMMYDITGDAKYAPAKTPSGKAPAWTGEGDSLEPGVGGKQQQWQGEGDSPASDPYARHRQLRKDMFGGKTFIDQINAYLDQQNDKMIAGHEKREAEAVGRLQMIGLSKAQTYYPTGTTGTDPTDPALNGTIGPKEDISGIARLRAEIEATTRAAEKLHGMTIAPGVGGALVAGGSVGKRITAELNDYGLGP